MRNIIKLTQGELFRLVKYMILPVSLITSIIWIIIFLLLSKQEALKLAPLFIYTDVTLMSVILLGASHHFEKQEDTIKTMMIMPVSTAEILTSKVIASMVLGLESTLVTALALYFIHGVVLDYLLMFLFVLVAGAAHAEIGFLLSLISRDFTTMLGWMMIYMFVFSIPTIFFMFGIIDAKYEWLLMISPSHAASNLMASAITGSYDTPKLIVALAYLAVLTFVLFKYAVYPKFKTDAVRG